MFRQWIYVFIKITPLQIAILVYIGLDMLKCKNMIFHSEVYRIQLDYIRTGLRRNSFFFKILGKPILQFEEVLSW
jgi:hypothetical protein